MVNIKEHTLLTERYRPTKLEDYVGNENIKQVIAQYLGQNDIQNLIFAGQAGTGKTTLVNALKELPQFKGYEFRTERSKYLRDLGIPLNTDSTLKGQTIFLAERCSELIQENIITDRTIIDVMAFAQASKSIDWADKEAFYAYAIRLIREYDYIFYVKIFYGFRKITCRRIHRLSTLNNIINT